MSVRRTAQPVAAPEQQQPVGLANFLQACTDAKYRRMTMPSGGTTYVFAEARGDEIVEVMKEALSAARRNVQAASGRIGRDNDSIEVSAVDSKKVPFSITIHIEHGGSKVIMRGNVGGSWKEHKLLADQRVSDDWISRATAGLFMLAGGEASDLVKIQFNEGIE